MVNDMDDLKDNQELKNLQELLRLRKQVEFGDIEKKYDCEYCLGDCCRILTGMYCKNQVCYFYNKKW